MAPQDSGIIHADLANLYLAVDNIDEVIKIIRGSQTREEASTKLLTRFEFTKKQTTRGDLERGHTLRDRPRDEACC